VEKSEGKSGAEKRRSAWVKEFWKLQQVLKNRGGKPRKVESWKMVG